MGKAPPGAGDRTLQVQEGFEGRGKIPSQKGFKAFQLGGPVVDGVMKRITAVVPEKRPGFSVSQKQNGQGEFRQKRLKMARLAMRVGAKRAAVDSPEFFLLPRREGRPLRWIDGIPLDSIEQRGVKKNPEKPALEIG